VGGTCGTHKRGEMCLLGFCSEAQREETTGRPRCRQEDNIKMDGRGIGIDGANWIRLAQNRVHWRDFVNKVMNLWFP